VRLVPDRAEEVQALLQNRVESGHGGGYVRLRRGNSQQGLTVTDDIFGGAEFGFPGGPAAVLGDPLPDLGFAVKFYRCQHGV